MSDESHPEEPVEESPVEEDAAVEQAEDQPSVSYTHLTLPTSPKV